MALADHLFLYYRTLPHPLDEKFTPSLIERYPREDHTDFPLIEDIPLFCFSEGLKLEAMHHSATIFPFVLSTSSCIKFYVTCLIYYEPLNEQLANDLNIEVSASRKVYEPKAICLISHYPFITEFKTILREIFRLSLSERTMPFERIICNLLQEIPLPDLGETSVLYSIGNEKVYFSRPPRTYLRQMPSHCLDFLFKSLPIENIITIWIALMLEKKVLLISSQKTLLTYTGIALVSLLFPFKWENPFIPILPSSLKGYIEAIFPYIIGISPRTLTKDIEVPNDAVLVNLDNGQIRLNEQMPTLPKKYFNSLLSRLNVEGNIYRKMDPIRETADEAFIPLSNEEKSRLFLLPECSIRDAFLELNTSLLKNYQNFLRFDKDSTYKGLNSYFEIKKFLSNRRATGPKKFLFSFVNTQLFAGFIHKHFTSEKQFDLSYFDKAMSFNRKTDLCFVVPYETTHVISGIPIDECNLTQEKTAFPVLRDSLLSNPRQIQTLVISRKKTDFTEELVTIKLIEWAKFLLGNIYKVWFLLFSVYLPRSQDAAERLADCSLFQLTQMKKTAEAPDLEIYRYLIRAFGYCGLQEKIQYLFKLMKKRGIRLDTDVYRTYVNSMSESYKFTGSSLSEDGEDLATCCFSTDVECTICGERVSYENVMKGWDRTYSTHTTKCDSCSGIFIAELKVFIERQSLHSQPTFEFLPPHILKKELNHASSSTLETLYKSDKTLYWNAVFYFRLIKLPTFFLNNTHQELTVIKQAKPPKRPLKRAYECPLETTSTIAHNSSDQKALFTRKNTFASTPQKKTTNSLLKLFSPYIEDFKRSNHR